MGSHVSSSQPVLPDPLVKGLVLDIDSGYAPARLQAASRLYGLNTAALGQSRVLVLAYGSGGVGLVHAVNHAEAEVITVEWKPENSEVLLELAAELKVGSNFSLRAVGLEEVTDDWGLFDYIVIPELFTLLPSTMRTALLQLCRNHLAPSGVACIGFETQPGGKAQDIVREYLGMRAVPGDAQQAIAHSRVLAAQWLDGLENSNPIASIVRPILESIPSMDDTEFAARLLGEQPTATYLVEFVSLAMENRLCYVGDAQPHSELVTAYGPQVALSSTLSNMGQPKVVRQQHLDLLVGRKSRMCLLTHVECEDQISATPELSRLKTMLVAGYFLTAKREETDISDGTRRFISQDGKEFVSSDALMHTVIDTLTTSWPLPLSFPQLIRLTAFPASSLVTTDEEHKVAVLACLEHLFRANIVRYSCEWKEAPSHQLQFAPYVALKKGKYEAQDMCFITPWDRVEKIPFQSRQRDALEALYSYETLEEARDALIECQWAELLTADDKSIKSKEALCTSVERSMNILEIRLLRCGALSGSRLALSEYHKNKLAEIKMSQWTGSTLVMLRQLLLSEDREVSLKNIASHKKSLGCSEADKKQFAKLRSEEKYHEGVALALKLTKKYSSDPVVFSELGKFRAEAGNTEQAFLACITAIRLAPLRVECYTAMADVMRLSQRLGDVEFCYRISLLLAPSNSSVWNRLGQCLRDRAALKPALEAHRRALALKPESADTLGDIGAVLSEQGRYTEAQAAFDQAVKLDPNHYSMGARLFVMARNENVTSQELFEAHREFGRMVESQINTPFTEHMNVKDPSKKLKVGVVSGDLRNHAISSFFIPFLENIDHTAIEVHAYYTWANEDDFSKKIQELVSSWTRVFKYSDEKLTRKIREDRIDVLVDLSGHTGGNRLRVFARKPAPVQLSWMGYPGTTGLLGMDYHLMSKHTASPGELDDQFTESLVYMPINTSFRPHHDSPETNTLPALRNGYLTFGSFNRYNKIGENTIRFWTDVMRSIPDSRMLIGNVTERELQKELIALYVENGVEASRLVFKPRAKIETYLGYHHDVDILLDTYPYTGGTTTNHALWMGVPVLTVRGQSRASRQTAGLLGCAGLTEWIADSQSQLIQQAQYWAENFDELAEIRLGLRGKIKKSDLYDEQLAARGFESAIRSMWERWCAGENPESFTVEVDTEHRRADSELE